MIDKETIASGFFDDCKPKELQTIKYTTPKGHVVEALICRKPNKYLGSLYIYNVDGEDVEQFVPSMPKIHYLDNYHKPFFDKNHNLYVCKEKLDGTCVIVYALKNRNGDVLEIVPKSRGMGVLDTQFYKKYDEIDTLFIDNYLMKHPKQILLFELYGMGNVHTIKHMDTYMDLAFLGYYNDYGDLCHTTYAFGEKKPRTLFSISYESGYEVDNYGLAKFFPSYVSEEVGHFQTIEDCVTDIQKQLEELNNEFYHVNNRLAIEGVVLNYKDEYGNCKYLKIKPFSIEIEHRSEGGIPRQFLMKELMKYLDEYGSMAKEEYEKSNKHYLSYMKRQLSEEFDELSIDKSEKKMLQYLEKRLYPQTDKELEDICTQLIETYPDRQIVDYMRLFSQEYPMLKKKSRFVYAILEERLL